MTITYPASLTVSWIWPVFELRQASQLVHVEPQVFDILAYLLKHRHRLVSKTELLDGVLAATGS